MKEIKYGNYERYYDLEYQMGYFSKLNIVTENESNKRIIYSYDEYSRGEYVGDVI